MISLEVIAIFITPIIGVAMMYERYKYDVKELLISYLKFLVMTNLINNVILYIFKDYIVYMFTVSFFVKYTILGIMSSILFGMFQLKHMVLFKSKVHQHNGGLRKIGI